MNAKYAIIILSSMLLIAVPALLATGSGAPSNINSISNNFNSSNFADLNSTSPGYLMGQPMMASSGSPPIETPTSNTGMIFDDEFVGNSLNMSKWSVCYADGYCYNQNNGGRYTNQEYAVPQNCVVNGSVLALKATKGNSTHAYFSCIVQTHGKFDFTYGYAQARIWFPNGQDSWSSFWMLPSSLTWPPEIDIAEQVGGGVTPAWYLHYWYNNSEHSLGHRGNVFGSSAGWHTYGVKWATNTLLFYFDGNYVGSVYGANVPTKPMYPILTFALGSFKQTRSRIDPVNYSYFNSCPNDTKIPFYSNSNYVVPYPVNVPSGCSFSLNNIQEKITQIGRGLAFNATFDVNGTSQNPSDEETVMAVDDILNWSGQSYGFRTSFSNNTIYGFATDGNGKKGGQTFFAQVPLMNNDNKKHQFTVSVYANSTTGQNIMFYYIDNVWDGTIYRTSPANYIQQNYHVVMTTHRWENGWSSDNSSLKVTNVTLLSVAFPPQVPETMKVDWVRVWQGSNTDYQSLKMCSNGNGTTIPKNNCSAVPGKSFASLVEIKAVPASGWTFKNWTCTGQGCYNGTSAVANVTMLGNITETANFIKK